jgi:diadenosine tetraphosphate (Ap4A) HIT family hydrolase
MVTVFGDIYEPACFICAASQGDSDSVPWYDRPLIQESEVGIAFSAVGAFVPGYVIVAPETHTRSIRDLPRGARNELLRFVRSVRARIERIYEPTTIFEHGSCQRFDGRRSACIEHSHIHIVPGEYGLDQLALRFTAFESLEAMLAAAEACQGTGYLMYQEPGGSVHYAADPGISQYFRRHIAAVLGEADAWDYAAVPRWDNVRATQLRFAEQAAEINTSRSRK